MDFPGIFGQALLLVIGMMVVVWIISVIKKNAGIVDIFWGLGFVLVSIFYFINTPGASPRKVITLVLVTLWGIRLAIYITWRNWGKEEDFRYREFRKKYGPHRYWWFSFFQVFLLQGLLLWLISAPLLGAQYYSRDSGLGILEGLGIFFWLIGFLFEAGGDWQMARFKSNPENRGKVLDKGFWKYTRHPNYFGDSCIWWGYGFLCAGTGVYWPIYGSVLMTLLIVRVSGVTLLEKTLRNSKPQYREYIAKTNSFLPWFPKK